MLWIGALYSSGAGRGPNGAVQPMRTNSRFPWPTSAAKVILKAALAPTLVHGGPGPCASRFGLSRYQNWTVDHRSRFPELASVPRLTRVVVPWPGPGRFRSD